MKKSQLMIFSLVILLLLIQIFNYQCVENLEDVKPIEFSGRTTYHTNNYDVQYHKTVEEIEKYESIGSWLIGASGKLEYFPWTGIGTQINYYKSGTYKYGATTWVPTYQDSILLGQK